MDKNTRFYVRCIQTNVEDEDVPSFVYSVKKAYEAANAQQPGFDANHPFANHPLCSCGKDMHDRFFIRFPLRDETIDRMTITATNALQAKASGSTLSVLKDRIVILGGKYRDYDRHFTPIGIQPGAIVLANALLTELIGPSVKARPHLQLFAFEAFATLVLIFVFQGLTSFPIPVLVWAVLLTAAVLLVFSHGSTPWLLSFAPTLLVVLLFGVIEHVIHRSVVQAAHPDGTSRS